MKIITIIAIFFFTLNTFAQTSEFWVIERRNKSNRTYYKKVKLPDLTSQNTFEGKFFKIVEGTGKTAISFDADEDLVLKAATAYYHLTKAREFWNTLTSEIVHKTPLIVRLEITNQYDELGHYAHQNRNPQYNNAVSVPAGKTPDWVPEGRKDEWEKEIWFRPLKYIDATTLPKPDSNPLEETIGRLRGPFINYTRNQFNQRLLEHLFYPNYVPNPLWLEFVRFAGTVAVTQLIYEGAKYADPLFMEKYYYLDTVMVPEVIYHEYSHIMLSDHMELTHSTSVTEGMADYFAAIISKRRKISSRVRGYSNAMSRDRNNRTTYNHWLESNQMANSDFVLSLLWDIREKFGEKESDKLIFESRKKIKVQTATIYNNLLQGIIESCDSICHDPKNSKLRLYQIFSDRGF